MTTLQMNTLEWLILGLFDSLSFILLIAAMTHQKKGWGARELAFVLTQALFALALGNVIPRLVYIGCNFIIYCAYVGIVVKWRPRLVFLLSISSLMVMLVVQTTIILVFQALFHLGVNFHVGLFAQVVMLLLVFLISHFAPLSVYYDFLINENKVFNVIILNIALVSAVLVAYWHLHLNDFFKHAIFILSAILLFTVVNFVILRNGLINAHQKKQLAQYHTYMEIVDKLLDEVRSVQHEYDNHIQSLKMAYYALDELHTPAVSYMKDLHHKVYFRDLIKLEDRIVAGLLFSKLKTAETQNIKMELVLETYFFDDGLRHYERVEMLGILLDNALQSCTPGGRVRCVLEENCYSVSNTHPHLSKAEMDACFEPGFSTKGTSRGYGLKNLTKMLRQRGFKLQMASVMIEGENSILLSAYKLPQVVGTEDHKPTKE